MSMDWADNTAEQLLSKDLIQSGICLILGASDTGKTTLAAALTKRLTESKPVGIIDADIGQSHIGPPTTVGWALLDDPQADFSQLPAGGISFVGNVTPVGHLLQLTVAIVQCVLQLSKLTGLVIIDTPGLVYGQAAVALWWTIQQMLKPNPILAVQQSDELSDILTGLKFLDSAIEPIKSPPQIQTKSPQQRQSYRQKQFDEYFQDSCLYNICISNVSIQSTRRLSSESLINRLVGLRNAQGVDLAIAIINDFQESQENIVIRAPKLDIRQVRCLVIGDITIEITDA